MSGWSKYEDGRWAAALDRRVAFTDVSLGNGQRPMRLPFEPVSMRWLCLI